MSDDFETRVSAICRDTGRDPFSVERELAIAEMVRLRKLIRFAVEQLRTEFDYSDDRHNQSRWDTMPDSPEKAELEAIAESVKDE